MAGWQVGLVVMMAVGVAVILFGALWDRERNRREADRLTRAPDRAIPGYAGADPDYVTALRPAEEASSLALTEERRAAVKASLAAVTRFDAGLAAADFVTDPPSGWAVLDDALVLACAEPVQTVHEILPAVQDCAEHGRPLVLVAPAYAEEVVRTLAANQHHRTLRVAVVNAGAGVLTELAAATGAAPLARIDLQAGWLPTDTLGSAATWVSSTSASWVLRG